MYENSLNLSNDSQQQRYTRTKFCLKLLEISPDGQSACYRVELEVGCVVAVSETYCIISFKLKIVTSHACPHFVSRMYLIGLPRPLSPSTATMLATKSPILLFSGTLVTGGAERKMGGESATFSTLMMNSWDARLRESLAPSTQAFYEVKFVKRVQHKTFVCTSAIICMM